MAEPSVTIAPADADTTGRFVWTRLRPRQWLGLGIVAAGALVALAELWHLVAPMAGVRQALLLGSVAALATALGVLPMLLARAPAQRTHDTLLGFGAGVMLAATCFSLLNPALAAAAAAGLGPWPRALGVGAALSAGAVLLMLVERVLPHAHFFGGAGRVGPARMRRVTLFVLAIVLHNVPEGLAIGVAVAGTDAARATALAVGIAIQDVPEGLVIALALHAVGVSHEVIPESHRQGHERWATAGLLLGFVLMMVLDTALG